MLELIIVIAIVAILAAVAVPAFISYLRSNRLKSAAEHLYSLLNLAHSEAIKQQLTVTVVFQTGTSWCYGVTSASSCDCSVASSCSLGQITSSAFPNVSFSTSGFASSTSFSAARGEASTTGSMIFTGSNGDSITIELNQLGSAKICSSTLGGYKPC